MDKMDFYTALSPTVLPLLKWYQAGHRDLPWRQNPTPYQVWISEIMLQQTRVQAVIPYYHRFLSLFPDVAALAQAPEEQLLKAWEGLGYYSRARNLQRAARIICDRFDGWLSYRLRRLARFAWGRALYCGGSLFHLFGAASSGGGRQCSSCFFPLAGAGGRYCGASGKKGTDRACCRPDSAGRAGRI